MKESSHFLRINGNGNAWPVSIGSSDPYYKAIGNEIIGNASYSILQCKGNSPEPENTDWEVLIDAGHGLVQFYLEHFNRLPDALVITHPHSDHILSAEYVAQNYYRKYNKARKLPVYCSRECMKSIITSFPHVKDICDFRICDYAKPAHIPEADKTTITTFPVYHGLGARGAQMVHLKSEHFSLVFTGDCRIPMLRQQDLEKLSGSDFLLPDCNNRFPDPHTNHWSITDEPCSFDIMDNLQTSRMLTSHLSNDTSDNDHQYLSDFSRFAALPETELMTNVLQFAEATKPKNIGITHYGGSEDMKYYNEPKLSPGAMKIWAEKEFKKKGISANLHTVTGNQYFKLGE